jgi:hypothetical protein
MKRYRINKEDNLKISVFHKHEQILNTINFSGFKNIEDLRKWIISILPWNYKGYGRRIEIEIFNTTKNEIKYITTFS